MCTFVNTYPGLWHKYKRYAQLEKMKRRQIIKIGVLSGLTAVLPKCTNLKETTKDKSKQMTDFRATGNIEETGWPDIRNKKMNW